MADPGAVLVTGASGYLGSALVRRLLADGRTVHAIARPTSDLARLGADAARVRWHFHDGATRSLVDAVTAARPDVCFHLAAHFTARHAADDVAPLVEGNVLFGAQLLEALAAAATPLLVSTGTVWQHYGGAAARSVALYAATREAFREIVRYYVDTAPLRAVTLELADTYGPDDPRPKLLNLLWRAAREGTILPMTPGEQWIDLVHVDDVVEAYLAAERFVRAKASPAESAYAVLSGRPVRLRELVALLERASGRSVPVAWGQVPYRPREAFTPWDLPTLPGWRARIALEEGLHGLFGRGSRGA